MAVTFALHAPTHFAASVPALCGLCVRTEATPSAFSRAAMTASSWLVLIALSMSSPRTGPRAVAWAALASTFPAGMFGSITNHPSAPAA